MGVDTQKAQESLALDLVAMPVLEGLARAAVFKQDVLGMNYLFGEMSNLQPGNETKAPKHR